MTLSTPQNVLVGFAAAGSLLISMMLVIVALLYGTVRDQSRVEHTHVVIASVERINSALQRAEAAQRAYVGTADEAYLAGRDDAMSQVESLLLDIRELTADNPSQQHRLAQLASLVQVRLEHMNDLFPNAPDPGPENVRLEVSRSTEETAAILAVVSEMQDEEQSLLLARSGVARRDAIAILSGLAARSAALVLLLSFLYIRIRRDLAARARLEEDLQKMAMTDALTGLPNRRSFMTLAERMVSIASRYGQPLGCLMLDADHFKKINDHYGHDAGDVVLRALAATLLGQLRNVDIIGRLGGEEFAVILPQTSLERSVAVAERLRCAIADATVQYGDTPIKLTVSTGVTAFRAGSNLEDMLAAADRGLYDAKRSGRDRVAVATLQTLRRSG